MNPIVGIGEVLWDVYPDGRKVAGGAPFNFAFHCHQLGHPAVIVSRVGNDDLGRELRERVRELGLSDEYIQTDYEHATGTVQVTLDVNKVPTYTITEDVAWDYITEPFGDLNHRISAICFGTLAQRTFQGQALHRNFLNKVAADRANALRVFDVNIRPPHYNPGIIESSIWSANWVKLSDEDLMYLTGMFGWDWCDGIIPISIIGQEFLDSEFNLVCYTRGESGCEVLRTNKPHEYAYEADRCRRWNSADEIEEPGVPARVADTVGAGDAFTAAMVCLYLEGKPLRECARFANHYATRVCEHPGGTPRIDRAEVERQAGVK